MTLIPIFSNGSIRGFPPLSTITGYSFIRLNKVGIEGPYISASKSPTEYPSSDSDKARPAATVDFPTPPLPEATKMMFLILGVAVFSKCWFEFIPYILFLHNEVLTD